MKFALKADQRVEATPNANGVCPCCGTEMIAKCGIRKVWHWAHKTTKTCDHWWESETQWHRNWKNCFPKEWQEVIHVVEDGEKHNADVKSPLGIVLEFQHSRLDDSEREARENYYENLVWVVDGARLKTDRIKFDRYPTLTHLSYPTLLSEPVPVNIFPSFYHWCMSTRPVFFDWRDKLFCLLPQREPSGNRLMFSMSHSDFCSIIQNAVISNLDFETIIRSDPKFELLKY